MKILLIFVVFLENMNFSIYKKKLVKSLTVAPFNIDVHAHLDPAEDLVLSHGHLHGQRLHNGGYTFF